MPSTASDLVMQEFDKAFERLGTGAKIATGLACAGALIFLAHKAFNNEENTQPAAEPVQQTAHTTMEPPG